ncbi:alpha/beta hydrolase [Acetobacter senegalensis]|uniref:alpha/beta hydrolase n=1 Tax=Acetobacter senegalensis TaxID=446692 RepID=UPI001EDB5BA6
MKLRTRVVGALMAGALMGASGLAHAATDEDISAPGPLGLLKGTLTRAGNNAPVMLILPGSGPTDRDGNNPLGVKAATYKLLAEGLAAQGISSVRVDKRGLFASLAAVANGDSVTVDNYVQDTRNWMTSIQKQTGAHCVWLMGHSEGGLIALATAADNPAQICGVVLVATSGRRANDLLKAQMAKTPLSSQVNRIVDALASGQQVDVSAEPPRLRAMFRPSIQGFWISAFSYDPTDLIAKIKLPVMIMQGERDLQVGVEDAQKLKAADPAAKLVLLPDTNHVLKTVSSDIPRENLATYADPNLPLAPGVVDSIAGFIKKTP